MRFIQTTIFDNTEEELEKMFDCIIELIYSGESVLYIADITSFKQIKKNYNRSKQKYEQKIASLNEQLPKNFGKLTFHMNCNFNTEVSGDTLNSYAYICLDLVITITREKFLKRMVPTVTKHLYIKNYHSDREVIPKHIQHYDYRNARDVPKYWK